MMSDVQAVSEIKIRLAKRRTAWTKQQLLLLSAVCLCIMVGLWGVIFRVVWRVMLALGDMTSVFGAVAWGYVFMEHKLKPERGIR